MAQCPHCEREVAVEYRYCPWCAEPLRLKLVELFRGADEDEAARLGAFVAPRRSRGQTLIDDLRALVRR